MDQLHPPGSLVPGSPAFTSSIDMSLEEVHDAHVRAVLVGLSSRTITPELAEQALQAMIEIAELEHYGEGVAD